MDKNIIKLIGWHEWVSLPDPDIPAIKAKVDTGGKTSALHTFKVDEISKNGSQYIRFYIHPLQKNIVDSLGATRATLEVTLDGIATSYFTLMKPST